MRALNVLARSSALSALVLAGALTLSGCGLFGSSEPSASASGSGAPASAGTSATSSAAPASPSPASAPASSAASSRESASAPAASGAGPSSEAAREASSCSGLSAAQAIAAAREAGLADVPDRWGGQDTAHYDDCSALSAVVVRLGGHAFAPAEVQLFHHGEPIGPATSTDYAAPEVERVGADTLRVTYRFPKADEAYAFASGRAVSEFRWDEAAGKVVHTGEFPPGYGQRAASAPASASSTPSRSASSTSGSASTLQHSDDVGFCFASSSGVSCFGKRNNVATLPATGTPTKQEDLPSTGWEEVPNPVTLAPGESKEIGPFECTATAGGFDCENTANGAAISVAGPTIRLTPPAR